MTQFKAGYLFKMITEQFGYKLNLKLEKYDLTLSQLRILKMILDAHSNHQPLFQRTIEVELKLSNPTVTGIIKRLETKKYVEKKSCSDDKRANYLLPTAAAIELDKIIPKIFDNSNEELLSCLNEREKNNLENYLNRILKNLEENL